ncbi:hypothetical protein [Psychrobacter sp. UBA3962]|uniref:hypothetical protein n=1 Tax=Psychrobacter sp. UBA3962 TaxID=1947352 RepID=UPI0025E1C3E1|nr:hypothetical protein [Psychrobacter sp. UBA3962]
MAVENLVDSFYQLLVSSTELEFKKVKHLQKCEPPTSEKTLDDVTATDDKRTVKAVVDFTEDSEIEFEFVLDPTDEEHLLIQSAYEDNTELNWQYKLVKATGLSRQFKGMVSKLTPNTDDNKKKVRMTGTITITSDPTKVLAE